MTDKQFETITALLTRIAEALEEKKVARQTKKPNVDALPFVKLLEENRQVLAGKQMTADEILSAIGVKNSTHFDRVSLSKAISFTPWASRKRTNKGAVFTMK